MALGGLVIGLYFRLGGIHSAFEAAGAFAVLMIAIYYFAQIFLFGAIITRVYAQTIWLDARVALIYHFHSIVDLVLPVTSIITFSGKQASSPVI